MSEHDSLPTHTQALLHASLYNHDTLYLSSMQKSFQILFRDPYLMKARPFDLTDAENRALTMRQISRVFQIRNSILKNAPVQANQAFMNVLNMYDRSLHMRLYVHYLLFKETLWSQGNDEINERFAEKIESGEVLGCFAMTELGHSSHLRGIETVATFDKDTDEFVIETTKLTGTKWWIGMAGQVATHTLALAQLCDHEGKGHGLYWFLVPMRNPSNGELLPGVTAGHLGAKAGRSGLDNGWIQFSQCRVPRANLLQRFVRVERDGTVVKNNSNPALSYMTLIGERVVALRAAFNMISQAATISVRYGVLRRQGPSDEKIMDYQSHYFNLMPVVSGAYALQYMHNRVNNAWQEAQQKFLSQSNATEFAEEVQYYHALSAGSKTFLGWWVADSLEVCRRSGGGHFYSAYNNISSIIADYAVITTGGGDNFVLGQQCTRYLLNQFKRSFTGKSVHRSMQYLTEGKALLGKRLSIQRAEDVTLEKLLETFQWLSLYLLSEQAKILASQGKDITAYWNDHIMDLLHVTEPYVYYSVLLHLKQYSEEESRNEPIRAIIRNMGVCFGLSLMEKLLDRFLCGGYMTVEEVSMVREARAQSSKKLRPICMGLVDAFGYPDEILKSPLAAYDSSRAYENYFAMVKNNSYVAPYWEQEVKSLLFQSRM